MKKSTKKILLLTIWACLFMVLYKKGLITTDTDKLRGILEDNPALMVELFVLISIGRVLFFIPGVVFMFLGGLFFGPLAGFSLSLVSIIISETIMYLIGRYVAGKRLNGYLNKSHRALVLLTDQHGFEFLALGILCPIAPSDVVCLISGMLNFNYKKYILTVILANVPMMSIYSYLGSSSFKLESSNFIVAVIAVVILIYTIFIWFKIKSQSKVVDI